MLSMDDFSISKIESKTWTTPSRSFEKRAVDHLEGFSLSHKKPKREAEQSN